MTLEITEETPCVDTLEITQETPCVDTLEITQETPCVDTLEITEETPCVEQIQGFDKKLYPYQLSTIYQMELMEEGCLNIKQQMSNTTRIVNVSTDMAILSNKIGSGKTLTILGLCKRNKHKLDHFKKKTIIQPLFNRCYLNNFMTYEDIERDLNTDNHLNTLIIVPVSIVKQWSDEISSTDLKVFIIKTSKTLLELDIESLKHYDIVLCTHTMYNTFINCIPYFKWNRIIIDEADSIKHLRLYIPSRFIWFVTATPESLLYASNSLIKSYFQYQNDHYNRNSLKYINIYCNENYMSCYQDYRINRFYIDCVTPIFLNILENHISNDIKELINAGDIQTAIIRLGGDVKKDTDLIKVFTDKITKTIEDLNNKILFTQKLNNLSENDKKSHIKRINNQITSLQTQLDSVKEKINEIKDGKCCICLENYINPVMTNCCNNIFCFDCIKSSLQIKPSCVFCRSSLHLKDLTVITHIKQEEKLTKENQCLKIIKNNPNSKFLIFSNHFFHKVKEVLQNNNIEFKELKGGKDIIERNIKNYKNNKVNILLLNAEYKGAGINLENTTDIIIYHKLSSDLEKQVVGRAIRLGRDPDIPLNIHYLKHENEYTS